MLVNSLLFVPPYDLLHILLPEVSISIAHPLTIPVEPPFTSVEYDPPNKILLSSVLIIVIPACLGYSLYVFFHDKFPFISTLTNSHFIMPEKVDCPNK